MKWTANEMTNVQKLVDEMPRWWNDRMMKRAGTNVLFVCGLDGGMYKLINFNDAQLNFVFEKL